jgi:plastocyanin
MPSPSELKNISFILYAAIVASAILVVGGVTSTVANFEVARAQIQSDLDATSVYDSGQMKLGNNVKHLVIVIPNEGHHGPGEEDEARFIAQPFIPQNATVTPGTQVVWFNGDVGHEHNIVVRDSNGSQLFETGEYTELQASRPITFNNTGEFTYADTVEYEEGFVMTGTIRVVDEKGVTDTPAATFDTVGALMVPSMDVQSIATNIKNAGFGIDSMHNFKDLRGGQSDTGDEQTLVIWTADGMDIEEIGSALKSISEELPYE